MTETHKNHSFEIGRLCGKLLAQAEIAQADAVRSVNWSGGRKITDRYYDFCVAHPAVAFPRLINASKVWTDKRDFDTKKKMKETIKSLELLTQSWPDRFSDQQKCAFAQGYALEITTLREERSEKIREAVKRKEGKND